MKPRNVDAMAGNLQATVFTRSKQGSRHSKSEYTKIVAGKTLFTRLPYEQMKNWRPSELIFQHAGNRVLLVIE